MRTLMSGGAHFELAVRAARQYAALEVETARRFFNRVAARTRTRSGSGLALLPESFASSGIASW